MDMIRINHDEARKKFDAAGKKLELMSIGQTIEI
jgi:hypothetical protein